jgi:hypothetical protein
MVRKLKKSDYDILRSYIDKDKILNIYLDYWLQTSGLDNENVNFVGAIDGSRLLGVLLIANFYKGKIGYLGYPVTRNDRIVLDFVKFGRSLGMSRLIGEKLTLEPALEKLRLRYKTRTNSLNFYRVLPGSFDSYHDYSVKIATKSETELLVELYKQFEYRKKKRSADEAKREIENVMKESGIFFMAVVDGRAVSAAKIATETDKAGIIGSARTLPEYRGRGIYLSVRTACFEYLFDKGKIGVGFFEDKNVNIHKILKKQGGFISNKWLIINFGRKQRTARRRFISLFLRQRSLNIFDRVLNRQN